MGQVTTSESGKTCESCREVVTQAVEVSYKLTDGTFVETVIICFRCYYQTWE